MSKSGLKSLTPSHEKQIQFLKERLNVAMSHLEVQRYINTFVLDILAEKAPEAKLEDVKEFLRLTASLSMVIGEDESIKIFKVIRPEVKEEKESENDTSTTGPDVPETVGKVQAS